MLSIHDLHDDLAALGLRFQRTNMGGGMCALETTLETGHVLLVTTGDGDLPDPDPLDDVLVGVYTRGDELGDGPLFYVDSPDAARAADAVTRAVAQLVAANYTDTTL